MAPRKSTTKKKETTAKKTAGVMEYDLLDGGYVDNNAEQDVKGTDMDPDLYKRKRMGLFDIVNTLFYRPDEVFSIPADDVRDNTFIINRRFGIMYPQQAAQLSHMKINNAGVLKFWSMFAQARHPGEIPRWMWTKTKQEKTKVGIDAFDEETIAKYMNRYALSRKDFIDMLQFYNDETVADVEHYFKMYSPEEQAKLFKSTKGSKKKFDEDTLSEEE